MADNVIVKRARCSHFTVIPSLSSLTDIISNRQKARCCAGLHILMLVCIGSVFGRGWPFADFVLTFIPTLYQQRKRDASHASSTQIKEGCATLLWAYLRDYQHENTTSQSSVGGRSVIVSCQTSKVPLTASYLTFSSNEFIFHSLVFWQRCHLWPNLAPFFHHVYCKLMISVWKLHLIWKDKKKKSYPHQEKVTSSNWWTGKCTRVVSVYDSLVCIWLIVKHFATIEIATGFWARAISVIHLQSQTYHEAILCDQPKPRRTARWHFTVKVTTADSRFNCIKLRQIWHII